MSEAIDLVVIGGSAGAIDALRTVSLHLTPRLRPAVAVVVHMAQDARAVLHEILSGAG